MNDIDAKRLETIRRINDNGGATLLDIPARPFLKVSHAPGMVAIEQGYPVPGSKAVVLLDCLLLYPNEAKQVHEALGRALSNLSVAGEVSQ